MLKRLESLEDRLKKRYEFIVINGDCCFITESGEVIQLTGLKTFNAIVIEYAESIEDAKKNIFEDGALFYLEDMNEDEMFEAMVKEIEEQE